MELSPQRVAFDLVGFDFVRNRCGQGRRRMVVKALKNGSEGFEPGFIRDEDLSSSGSMFPDL